MLRTAKCMYIIKLCLYAIIFHSAQTARRCNAKKSQNHLIHIDFKGSYNNHDSTTLHAEIGQAVSGTTTS